MCFNMSVEAGECNENTIMAHELSFEMDEISVAISSNKFLIYVWSRIDEIRRKYKESRNQITDC